MALQPGVMAELSRHSWVINPKGKFCAKLLKLSSIRSLDQSLEYAEDGQMGK